MQLSIQGLLAESLREFGLSPSPDAVQAIGRHLELVSEWNERVNLTALKDEREMVVKHAIDSASVFSALELSLGCRVLDVGTGAGFPGITLKCLRPDLNVVLLESLQKRCRFLEIVKEEVVGGLLRTPSGCDVVWGRAEDLGRQAGFRESFDLVTARAVAELRVLAEYCLPFCRIGGSFVAMKGPAAFGEIEAATRAIEMLGGSVGIVKSVSLPEQAGERTLVRIDKVKDTPKAYPRKAGTPAKSPL